MQICVCTCKCARARALCVCTCKCVRARALCVYTGRRRHPCVGAGGRGTDAEEGRQPALAGGEEGSRRLVCVWGRGQWRARRLGKSRTILTVCVPMSRCKWKIADERAGKNEDASQGKPRVAPGPAGEARSQPGPSRGTGRAARNSFREPRSRPRGQADKAAPLVLAASQLGLLTGGFDLGLSGPNPGARPPLPASPLPASPAPLRKGIPEGHAGEGRPRPRPAGLGAWRSMH